MNERQRQRIQIETQRDRETEGQRDRETEGERDGRKEGGRGRERGEKGERGGGIRDGS